jgi:16S rRNA (cytidine1402-2'-O)-methyltransferase
MSAHSPRSERLDPGLYLIATPIGAARDITLRALDILASADILAAEDTRTLRHLMEIHAIPLQGRPLIAHHDHNAAQAVPRLLQAIAEGKSVAYASEAGTPLISDPGFQLGRAVIAAGQSLISAPGPSAVLCALTQSGLPSDQFYFAGFPPTQSTARRAFLRGMQHIQATLILYESPKRIHKLMDDAGEVLGYSRCGCICRELTKRFEEVSRGTIGDLITQYAGRDVKGEIVVLIDRAAPQQVSMESIELALDTALAQMSLKDAVANVASAYGMARRTVYDMALRRGRA